MFNHLYLTGASFSLPLATNKLSSKGKLVKRRKRLKKCDICDAFGLSHLNYSSVVSVPAGASVFRQGARERFLSS